MHELCSVTYAWCVLPNHYHLLLKTERIKDLRHSASPVSRTFILSLER